MTNFKVSEDRKTVSWKDGEKLLKFKFQYPVSAHHIKYLDKVLIHSSTDETGETNLAIYDPDGTMISRPPMPTLKHKVFGVYSVWFEQNQRKITVVLLSDEYVPYDTACSFDLETYEFSKFHPTY
jgi:hypothetical protein